MAVMTRFTLIKIHMLLAAFIFPVAVMYLVTGGLYTWGIKGAYDEHKYDVVLDGALSEDEVVLKELAASELRRLAIAPPTGGAKIKRIGQSFQLEWTGSERDVILKATGDPKKARLLVKETTWYRHLVQLHKAKGGQLFKVYAAILAISLFTILLSGFLMAWQIPKFRKLVAACSVAGVVMFVLMVGIN
jgi:hypothetical protein